MDPVEVWGDDEVVQDPVECGRHTHVGVRPQGDRHIQELVDHEHPGGETTRQDHGHACHHVQQSGWQADGWHGHLRCRLLCKTQVGGVVVSTRPVATGAAPRSVLTTLG